jgi:hypothetical protein
MVFDNMMRERFDDSRWMAAIGLKVFATTRGEAGWHPLAQTPHEPCLRHESQGLGRRKSLGRELAGHSSSAINTHYTHLPIETLTRAIDQLPLFVREADQVD